VSNGYESRPPAPRKRRRNRLCEGSPSRCFVKAAPWDRRENDAAEATAKPLTTRGQSDLQRQMPSPARHGPRKRRGTHFLAAPHGSGQKGKSSRPKSWAISPSRDASHRRSGWRPVSALSPRRITLATEQRVTRTQRSPTRGAMPEEQSRRPAPLAPRAPPRRRRSRHRANPNRSDHGPGPQPPPAPGEGVAEPTRGGCSRVQHSPDSASATRPLSTPSVPGWSRRTSTALRTCRRSARSPRRRADGRICLRGRTGIPRRGRNVNRAH
jgi:hypothetical protein